MVGEKRPKRMDTRLVHSGSHPERFDGAVNPPVYRISTVVSADIEEMRHRATHPPGMLAYGRAGTPTHWALQEAIADLEGYAHCIALPSGLAGITTTLLGLCSAGDHVLVADNVYGPIRLVCCDRLSSWGWMRNSSIQQSGAALSISFGQRRNWSSSNHPDR